MSSSEGGRPPGKPATVPPPPSPSPSPSSTVKGMPAQVEPRERRPSSPPRAKPPTTPPANLPPLPRPTRPSQPPPPTPAAGVPYAPPPPTPAAGVPQYQYPAHRSGPQFGGLPSPAAEPSGPHFGGPQFAGRDEPAPASLPPGYDPADDEEVPGSQFVKFLKISSRRAFRLRIEPSEVLPGERRSLLAAQPPITDVNLQAFLAWRRSVLFLVACALLPLTIIGLIDALAGTMAMPIRLVRLGPAIAEAVFCWICWRQLKRWAHWRTQRRWLFWGWVLFMAAPFVVFLYPLRSILLDTVSNPIDTLRAWGVGGSYRRAVMPFVFSMIAMLQLAPKAISLMPGLIRASLVIKLLFPGSSAPGWIIVMAAPLYALLAYVVLVIPYQFTGSGWFIAGVLGIIAGQAVLARAGFALAQPLSEEEALVHIKRVRFYYVTVMIVSAVLIIVALGSLVHQLSLRWADVVTAVLKFETNVLILTMIGADLVITNLDRARSKTAGRGHVEDQAEVKIAAFVSLGPPPSDPAA